MKIRFIYLIPLVLASIIKPSMAEVVVRMEFQQGTASVENVDIKLFENDAPFTVKNFMNYVDTGIPGYGDYTDSFIHRTVPGFIVQGGGFNFDPLASDFPLGLAPMFEGPAVANEYQHSNVRGTIAMAKLNNEPNSATSQWFFNLTDSSANLDVQNGGFTVFGEVLGNGMSTIDSIAAQPRYNRSDIDPVFTEFPIVGYVSEPVLNDNLVKLNAVTELFTISPDVAFGLVAPGSVTLPSTITITNAGSSALVVGSISTVNPAGSPFAVLGANCDGVTLAPASSCNIDVSFSPPALVTSYYTGSFNVAFPGLGWDYQVTLSGFAGSSMADFYNITSAINYGASVTMGTGLQSEFTINNTSNNVLQIGAISAPALPFSIEDTRCDNIVLQPGEQCSDLVRFSPGALECGLQPVFGTPEYTVFFSCISVLPSKAYSGELKVHMVNYGLSHTISLAGTGAVAADEADIHLSFSSVDFGIVDVLDSQSLPYVSTLIMQNKGTVPMDFAIGVTGTTTDNVYYEGSCVGISTLAAGYGCSVLVRYKPLTEGVNDASISITSNDLDESPFIIPIRGSSVLESDGVAAAIEDAGPNNGDGNNDDILDSKQSYVATLLDAQNRYVTYQTIDSYRITNMSVVQPANVDSLPANLIMGSGILDFKVEGVTPGQTVEVGIIMPAGMNLDTYYMYGPTTDNSVDHWYDFAFDGEVGSFMLGAVTFTTSTGSQFNRSVASIVFKDGGKGDADMTVNGVITITGAVTIKPSSSDSGAISLLQLLCLITTLISVRYYLSRQ